MKALKLQVLDASDRDILDQYVCVTRPIAFYLDVMQKEKNSFLGCVIPTIQKIGTDLTKLDFQEKSFGGLIRKGLWEFILKRWCYYSILLENLQCHFRNFVHYASTQPNSTKSAHLLSSV